MRWINCLLFLLATLAQSCAASASFVSWNMQWFPGTKPTSTPELRALQMSEAKEALISIQPDVFCAQEIRNWEVFEEVASVIPSLEPLVVSSHRDSRSGGALSIQQIGIAAKYPALGAWSEAFRPSPDAPPRGFAFAALDVGNGATILLYSVHLKSNLGEKPDNVAKREDAAHQILKHADKMQRAYRNVLATIVCGDFNTDPVGPEFDGEKTFQSFFEAGFRWPWQGIPKEARVTHPGEGKYPPATFDHFLIRGTVAVASCRPIEIDTVSDHRPVELVLQW